MTDVLPVDIEALLIEELLADPDIALLVSSRIYRAVPRMPKWPLLTVSEATETSAYPHWFGSTLIQYDAWADTQPQASLLARTTQMALKRIEGRTTSHGFVSAVNPFGRQWLPDTSSSPARPRVFGQAFIYAHPIPA